MWQSIKSIFTKRDEKVLNSVFNSIIEEYQNVHFTFDSCPSCNFKLESIPKRKKKCSECKAYIFVGTNYKLNKKILLTEKDSKQLKANRSKISFIKKWVQVLGDNGISEQNYFKRFKEACENRGMIISHSDFIWSMFKYLISETQEAHKLKVLYYSMALFLREEKKDFFKVLQESKKWELLYYKEGGYIKKVEILASKDSCETCKKQGGKIFTINKALDVMPIPCKDCSHYDNFCRCCYISVSD